MKRKRQVEVENREGIKNRLEEMGTQKKKSTEQHSKKDINAG